MNGDDEGVVIELMLVDEIFVDLESEMDVVSRAFGEIRKVNVDESTSCFSIAL